MSKRGLAKHACGSCPYRQDVPPGIWHDEEYAKLPNYDLPTGEQPVGIFLCHQQDGRLCAGWVGCHDMEENMALRMAVPLGSLDLEDVEAARAYVSPVPLFASGAEAAEHGLNGGRTPQTIRTIERLSRKRSNRAPS